MKTIQCVVLAAVTMGLTAASEGQARADQVHYVGMHPIHTGGFCHIEAAHVHVYAPKPKAKVMYRQVAGAHYFVGDPVAFNYEGPRYSYYGHHPVDVELSIGNDPGDHTEYCYLNGPHYHHYWPTAHADFELKGDAYWYVGDLPQVYVRGKKRYSRINVLYKPIAYSRPVITVEPPSGYVGVVVPAPHVDVHAGGGAVVGGGVGVGVGVSAGVEVHVPQPVLEVEVGVPGLIIETDHHHHYKHKRHRKHRKHKKFKRHGKHKGARRIRF